MLDALGQKADTLTVTTIAVHESQEDKFFEWSQKLNTPLVTIPVSSDQQEFVLQNSSTVVDRAQTQNKSTLLKSIDTVVQKIKDSCANICPRDTLAGIGYAVTSGAIGFLGLYYVAGQSAQESAILTATMLSVAVFHSSFTNTWQDYLKNGLYIKNIAGFFKKSLKENELIKATGNIAAGAVFNILPTVVALKLTGEYQTFASAALIGMLGAYDYTIDIAAGKLERRGKISEAAMKKIVRLRLLGGPVLEVFSLSGSPLVRIAMGAIGTAGVVGILAGEQIFEGIEKILKIKPQDYLKPMMNSIVEPINKIKANCNTLLGGEPNHAKLVSTLMPHTYEDIW